MQDSVPKWTHIYHNASRMVRSDVGRLNAIYSVLYVMLTFFCFWYGEQEAAAADAR